MEKNIKKDEKSDLYHIVDANRHEIWYKRDELNRIIYSKHSTGEEIWNYYKDDVMIRRVKNPNGIEEIYEIYSDGTSKSYEKKSNGFKSWCEYDKYNRLIKYRNSDGFEQSNEYGENGLMIVNVKKSNGFEICEEYKNNKIFHAINNEGTEKWWEYHEDYYELHVKESDGFEYWQKYNNNDILLYIKNSDGEEFFGDSNDPRFRFMMFKNLNINLYS